MLNGQFEVYDCPNLKSEDKVSKLREIINQLRLSYHIVSDLKRSNQSFSKKWILKELKRHGFKWRRVPRNTLKPKEKPNSRKIYQVISHLAQA